MVCCQLGAALDMRVLANVWKGKQRTLPTRTHLQVGQLRRVQVHSIAQFSFPSLHTPCLPAEPPAVCCAHRTSEWPNLHTFPPTHLARQQCLQLCAAHIVRVGGRHLKHQEAAGLALQLARRECLRVGMHAWAGMKGCARVGCEGLPPHVWGMKGCARVCTCWSVFVRCVQRDIALVFCSVVMPMLSGDANAPSSDRCMQPASASPKVTRQLVL